MAKSKSSDLVNVKFLLSPTGRFGLGYSIGEQGQFSAEQAAELVESGYAVVVDAKAETAPAEETK